jgi:WD40 repeat protein
MKHWDEVTSLALTADDKTLISGGTDGTVKFWDTSTGRLQFDAPFRAGLSFPARVQTVALSPDGKTLAIGGDDVGVGIYDMASGKHRGSLIGGSGGTILAWSPDGLLLASASCAGDGTVDLWDPFALEHLRHFGKHDSPVRTVAFDTPGELLASASDNGTVKIWDVKTGAERRSFNDPSGFAWGMAFCPDGRLLVTSASHTAINCFDPKAGELLQTFKGKTGHYRVVAGLSNGEIAAIGYGVEFFDEQTYEVHRHIDCASDPLGSATRSRDGRILSAGSYDGFIWMWNIETSKPVLEHRGHQAKIHAIAVSSVSPDSSTIASASIDGTVRLWDPVTSREVTVHGPA